MHGFFPLPSEFITLVKGTNYDLRPAPVATTELRREIHLEWVRMEQLKGC